MYRFSAIFLLLIALSHSLAVARGRTVSPTWDEWTKPGTLHGEPDCEGSLRTGDHDPFIHIMLYYRLKDGALFGSVISLRPYHESQMLLVDDQMFESKDAWHGLEDDVAMRAIKALANGKLAKNMSDGGDIIDLTDFKPFLFKLQADLSACVGKTISLLD